MPVISMFYGIVITMFFFDDDQHHAPHVHVRYQGKKASLSISDGEVLAGSLPKKQLKLVQAWLEIHNDELLANWELAANGEQIFKIDPLK